MLLKGVWSWKVSGYLLRENPRAHASPQHPLVLGPVHTLVLFYVLIGEGKGAKCVMHQPSTLSPSISCTCHSSPGGRQMLSSLPLDREENLQHRGTKSLAKAASAKSQDLTPGSLPMPPHVAGSLDQVIFFTLLLQVLSQHQTELGKDKWKPIKLAGSPVLPQGTTPPSTRYAPWASTNSLGLTWDCTCSPPKPPLWKKSSPAALIPAAPPWPGQVLRLGSGFSPAWGQTLAQWFTSCGRPLLLPKPLAMARPNSGSMVIEKNQSWQGAEAEYPIPSLIWH